MFIDDSTDLRTLAARNGFSIFVGNFDTDSLDFPPSTTFTLKPDEKSGKISIESVRDFIALTATIPTSDTFLIVISPESMTTEAENAILKNLEEPGPRYHYLFFTTNLRSLLPTILSRAHIYIKKLENPLSSPVVADDLVKSFAKRLIVATPRDLPALAKEIADKKDRPLALDIISAAIEISYKSYFKTKNPLYLEKIPNLLTLHENISSNGHIKLHFLADMI